MTPIDWLLGGDTGTSSKTICAVMTGSKIERPSEPSDPSDFGRCYRLLKLFPSWRGRLDEVAFHYPMWIGLVREWDTLTAMYEEELAGGTGRAPRLYKRMKELVDEGRIADGMVQTAPGCWSRQKKTVVDLGSVTITTGGL